MQLPCAPDLFGGHNFRLWKGHVNSPSQKGHHPEFPGNGNLCPQVFKNNIFMISPSKKTRFSDWIWNLTGLFGWTLRLQDWWKNILFQKPCQPQWMSSHNQNKKLRFGWTYIFFLVGHAPTFTGKKKRVPSHFLPQPTTHPLPLPLQPTPAWTWSSPMVKTSEAAQGASTSVLSFNLPRNWSFPEAELGRTPARKTRRKLVKRGSPVGCFFVVVVVTGYRASARKKECVRCQFSHPGRFHTKPLTISKVTDIPKGEEYI